MNAILGGQFSSRINLNLREDKGYTYGARSQLRLPPGPRPVRGRRLGPDRRDQGGAGRAGQGADRHHRPPARSPTPSSPSPRTGSSRASRTGSRRPSASPGPWPTWSSTTCRPTTSPPTSPRSRPSPRPTSTGSPRSTSTRSTWSSWSSATAPRSSRRCSLPYAKVINALDPEGNPLPPGGHPGDQNSGRCSRQRQQLDVLLRAGRKPAPPTLQERRSLGSSARRLWHGLTACGTK